MINFIKQVFIPLLSFNGSLAKKCVSLSNEPCMARPTLTDLNPNEINYYPFIINLDKYNESYKPGSC